MANETPNADDGYAEAESRINTCRKKGRQGDFLDLSGLDLTTLPPEIGQLTGEDALPTQ